MTAKPPSIDSPFLQACRRERTPFTPIWLMRQAGRYMKEYRDLRAKYGFMELCKNSDLACEVTVHAAQRLGVDAAIIFSDLLLILEPIGMKLSYASGDGPMLANPLRSPQDVERLQALTHPSPLSFVYDAIRKTRASLPAHLPLIGFAGAPFTLASYMIEGGGSDAYLETKTFMRRETKAWNRLMKTLAQSLVVYLNAQIQAGAQAVQLFDSWVGCLSPYEYETYALPHTRWVIRHLKPRVPVIHFGTGSAALLDLMKSAGSDVIGLDWRVELGPTWKRLGGVAIQGNMDPTLLFSSVAHVRAEAKRILKQAAGRPGHIFNLGHGILPGTPVDHVLALIDTVHEWSPR